MADLEILKKLRGFDWDDGNSQKNWLLHQVGRGEAEQVFFNEPIIISDDHEHSLDEARYYVLGQTNSKRLLFIVFTIRGTLLRIISARDMSKKERKVYRTL